MSRSLGRIVYEAYAMKTKHATQVWDGLHADERRAWNEAAWALFDALRKGVTIDMEVMS